MCVCRFGPLQIPDMFSLTPKMLAIVALSGFVWLAVFAAPMDPFDYGGSSHSPYHGWLSQDHQDHTPSLPYHDVFLGTGLSPSWHPDDVSHAPGHSLAQHQAWQPGDIPTWSAGFHAPQTFGSGSTSRTSQQDHSALSSLHLPSIGQNEAEQSSEHVTPMSEAEMDQAILNSLLSDLQHQEEAHAQPHHHSTSVVHNDIVQVHPTTDHVLGDIHVPNEEATVSRVKLRDRTTEPQHVRVLPDLPALNQVHSKVRAKVYVSQDPHVRDLINSRAFEGRLLWVDLADVPDLAETLKRKSPVKSPSRRLPWISMPAPPKSGLGSIGVYVTEHGNGKTLPRTAGTIIGRKPFYAFWGMPDRGFKERILFSS